MKKDIKKKKIGKGKVEGKKLNKAWWKTALIILLFVGIVLVSLFGLFVAYIVLTTKDFDPNRMSTTESSIIYDKDGKEIVTLGISLNDDLEKREKITYDDLPQVLVDALIATEDSRFFQHNGVDLARFTKATVFQLLGRNAGGASTLTMQVSKNNFTDTNSSGIKGIIRKFRDIYISVFQIEKKYTKQEIIEFYLNDNLLGGSNYGVEQASQYYFGKSASELNLAEASLLAGMYQSPNAYNPYNNPENATKRRKTVLNLMVRHGYITKDEAAIANSIDVTSLLSPDNAGASNEYAGFVDIVLDEVYEKTKLSPYKTSMKIYTTMDRGVQDGLNKIMSGEAHKWRNEVVQSGIAVTDVNTGALVAVGAGRNRTLARSFNFATMAEKQPGSTAKPLFDYAPGIEHNNWSTYQLFMDEPWTYSSGTKVNNYDNKYKGLITLKQALSNSRNIPALKAYQQLEYNAIHNFVASVGIIDEDEPIYESYAIGGLTTGVSPLQLSSAYASFANGGYYTEPYTITKIVYRDTSEEDSFKVQKNRVMKDSTAYIINNALEYACNYGFSGGAKVSGMAVAAKTGTSNFSDDDIKRLGLRGNTGNDLWTVAYTPEYSIALWYGYDTVTSENYHKSGAGTDKDNVMKSVMKYIPKTTKKFTVPSSAVISDVEFGSWPAMLPSSYTPTSLIIKEAFVKGAEPSEVSERFNKLNDVTNLQVNYSSLTNSINMSWNHAIPNVVTDDYLNSYFKQSVFGNSSSKYLNDRLSYNLNTLGGFGYGIYQKNSDGSLKYIAFTTSNSYNYAVSSNSNITIVVKAEYGKFKSNASNGVAKSVSVTGGSAQSNLTFSLQGDSIVNLSVSSKTYSDSNPPISVLEKGKNIYNTCSTTATLTAPGSKEINISVPISFSISNTGNYIINYTVKCGSETQKLTRKIVVS